MQNYQKIEFESKNRKRSSKRELKHQFLDDPLSPVEEDIPPKSAVQELADKEWIESIAEELTEQEKSYLLAINDQSDRNKAYSGLIRERR